MLEVESRRRIKKGELRIKKLKTGTIGELQRCGDQQSSILYPVSKTNSKYAKSVYRADQGLQYVAFAFGIRGVLRLSTLNSLSLRSLVRRRINPQPACYPAAFNAESMCSARISASFIFLHRRHFFGAASY
jgi:hypothetical protein